VGGEKTGVNGAIARDSPNPAHLVLVEYSVGAHDRYAQHERLRNQKPVEWVAMMQWQQARFNRMPKTDWQFCKILLR
jgi:hypothetical protein